MVIKKLRLEVSQAPTTMIHKLFRVEEVIEFIIYWI